MAIHSRKKSGFSMMELLVVLTIIGILAVVGVSVLGNRQAGSVRALLDEIEGSLANAHKAAVATGRDVAIVGWGTWDAANPLVIAHGDAGLTDVQIQATAQGLLNSELPPAALANGNTVAVPFHFMPIDGIQTRARIAVMGSGEWNQAMMPTPAGNSNQDITTVIPFDAGGTLAGLSADGNSFFRTAINRTVISGTNKRFNTPFAIRIVGTSPGAGVIQGGPMGLLVVMGNGSSIYKFYNSGVRDGDGQWRRL